MAASKARSHSSAQKVKHILAQKEFPAALLLVCPDSVRKERILELLIEKGTGKKISLASACMALTRVDARELDQASLHSFRLDTATQSLFSPTRFFIIDHMQELASELAAALLDTIKQSSPGTFYIVTACALPAAHPCMKYFSKLELCISLEQLQGAELKHWTERELARQRLQAASESVIPIIIDIAEENPDKIVRVIEQIALFMSDPGNEPPDALHSISEEDVLRLFSYHPSAGEFQFLDAVTQGKPLRAEFLLRQLIASGKNPFGLVALAARTFMQLFALKSLTAEKLSPLGIQERLGLSPWLYKKHMSTLNGYTLEDLGSSLAVLLRLDSKLKNRSLGAEAIVGEALWGLRPQKTLA